MITGFNPEQVAASINGVKAAYNNLMNALKGRMQNEFVGGMTTVWACDEAQTFFTNSFKPAIDSLITQSTTIFQSVVVAMNSAASNWASSTGTSWASISFEPMNTLVDVTGIQTSINGVKGIDLLSVVAVKAKLAIILSDAQSALQQAINAVQNSGFAGGSQGENLIASLGTIKTNIENATSDITTATETSINNTVTAYGDLGGKVAAAFSAQ